MAPRETKPAKLDPEAHAALGRLCRAVAGRGGLPRDVDRTDVLSALVLYTPPPQVAWMLSEYWRYSADPLEPVSADDGAEGGDAD